MRRNNKSMLIVGGVLGITVAVRLISSVLPQGTGAVDPRVRLQENQAQEIVQKQRQQQAGAFMSVVQGEVFRTEERIREAVALATAASLFAANETLNKRTPANVNALLSRVNSSGMMPPGLQLLGPEAEVVCSHGKFVIRYKPEPLSVEVVSVGKVRSDGPMLIVRVPDKRIGDMTEEGAGLYLATRLEQITVPPTFAHQAELVGLGFAPEPLRAARLPKPAPAESK